MEKPDWLVDPVGEEYYAQKAKGNWIILAVIMAFVAFTVAVVVWKFDTAEFMRITQEHEAEQERIKAAQEALVNQAVREGEAAAAARGATQ